MHITVPVKNDVLIISIYACAARLQPLYRCVAVAS